VTSAYSIRFPQQSVANLDQDKAYFYITQGGKESRVRFHDYDVIYSIPGLYEQLFYERLKCQSPAKVTEILHTAVEQTEDTFTKLRVLDLGAGNGMMGEALREVGVARILGIDIIPEAKESCERDRPGIYDEYHVMDFTKLSDEQQKNLGEWQFDCLTTVASLGFGDIPPEAFVNAFNMIRDEGWVAFNIKETFFGERDTSGFSKMIRELILSQYVGIYCIERYRHRLSIDGEPIYYFAIAGRKHAAVPKDFLNGR